jgi:phosphoribosylaminoimidazole-succinocarboxamide synthase
LTTISLFWFKKLSHIIPNHLITNSIASMPPEIYPYAPQLLGRAMLVRKAKVIPLEAIVRGYLSGKLRVHPVKLKCEFTVFKAPPGPNTRSQGQRMGFHSPPDLWSLKNYLNRSSRRQRKQTKALTTRTYLLNKVRICSSS